MSTRIKSILAGLLIMTSSGAAMAASWPERPIRWIVPFPPGGATDVLSRAAADKLAKALGQSVVVENVPGASGALGLERLTRSTPDGYTIGTSPNSMQAVLPYLSDNPLPFDTLKDFTPLGGLASFQYVIDVKADSPIKSLNDLINAAKKSPGSISMGTTGLGAGSHLGGILLAHKTGVQFNDIRYKGGAPALTDLMGGHIDFVVDPVGGSLAHIDAGKLRAIAATGSKRIPLLPNVPLVSETVPGYDLVGWFGLYGPAGMPSEVVQKISDNLIKIQKDPEFLAVLQKLGYDSMSLSSTALEKRQQKEFASWGEVLKATGLAKERQKK